MHWSSDVDWCDCHRICMFVWTGASVIIHVLFPVSDRYMCIRLCTALDLCVCHRICTAFLYLSSQINSSSGLDWCVFHRKCTTSLCWSLCRSSYMYCYRSAMVLGKFPVSGRPTILIAVGQGPTALAVGAGGGGLDIFAFIYPFSLLSPSLWETARYRLKYCLKGPLNPQESINQSLGWTGVSVIVYVQFL